MRRLLDVVVVSGTSMLPTLRPGDCLLVRRGGRVRPGDVVVVEFLARPGVLAVKRAVRPRDGAWHVESDNPAAGDDSRSFGAGEVCGRVLLRYWPPSAFGRLPRSAARS